MEGRFPLTPLFRSDIFAELSKSTGEIHVWLIWICINI